MSYLKITTPTNLAAEKERFFASDNYSPQLKYDWSEQNVNNFLEHTPSGTALAKAILNQDGKAITQEASKFFDVKFRPEDIDFAYNLISNTPPSANGTVNEYAELMRQKLTQLGIDYKVEIVDEHGFQGRPNHEKHILKLSKYMHLQFLSLNGIVNHELTHIIRAVNGEYNHISKSANYLPTEEGLACLIQDEFLVKPTSSSYQHSLEFLAANLSQTAGFREIFDFLTTHGFDSENAWLRGIRQKFGLCDTSQPGGIVKSGMYFYHENILKHLNKNELLRLFVGKISLDELDQYPVYTGKIPQSAIEEVLFTPSSS